MMGGGGLIDPGSEGQVAEKAKIILDAYKEARKAYYDALESLSHPSGAAAGEGAFKTLSDQYENFKVVYEHAQSFLKENPGASKALTPAIELSAQVKTDNEALFKDQNNESHAHHKLDL